VPAPYTDLLNEAIDDLTATLTAVTGLRVINDPTKLVPNAVFLQAPSFTTIAGNGNIVRVDFPDQSCWQRPSRATRVARNTTNHSDRAWLERHRHVGSPRHTRHRRPRIPVL
jgi:hypothetical protein